MPTGICAGVWETTIQLTVYFVCVILSFSRSLSLAVLEMLLAAWTRIAVFDDVWLLICSETNRIFFDEYIHRLTSHRTPHQFHLFHFLSGYNIMLHTNFGSTIQFFVVFAFYNNACEERLFETSIS